MDQTQKIVLAVLIVILIMFIVIYYVYFKSSSGSSTTALSSSSLASVISPTSTSNSNSNSSNSNSSSSTTSTPTSTNTSTTAASGTYMGCYTDSATRVLPTSGGTISWSACSAKAAAAGSPYFGMEYNNGNTSGLAQCYYGGSNYSNLGSATTCTAKDPSGHTLGGSWSIAVYKT